MAGDKKKAALHLARDLTMKLIEQRALSPDMAPEALALFNIAAKNLFAEINDEGLFIVRAARDFTVKQIERKQVSSPQDVAAQFVDNAHLLWDAAKKLPPESAAQSLSVAVDLTLKFMEMGRLSPSAAPELLSKLCNAARN